MCDGMNRVEFKHETGNIDVFILNNGSWLIPYCKNYMRAVFGKTEVIYPYNLPLFNCFLICVQIWKICKKVVFYEWILEMLSLQVQFFFAYTSTQTHSIYLKIIGDIDPCKKSILEKSLNLPYLLCQFKNNWSNINYAYTIEHAYDILQSRISWSALDHMVIEKFWFISVSTICFEHLVWFGVFFWDTLYIFL